MKRRGKFLVVNKDNIILSKKGLSEIVATLIIILLTLVAVGIIWVVINSLLRSGTQQIELGQYNIDLKITKVQVAGDNITVTVYVKRNAGQGNFSAMDFVFSNRTTTETIRQNSTIPELGTQSFTFVLSKIKLNTLQSVSVAPVSTSGVSQSVGTPTSTFDVTNIVKNVGTGSNQSGNSFTPLSNFASYGYTRVGEVSYTVSGGNFPNFKNATVNPLDVQLGNNQTFTATVYSPYNVTNVTSFTQLDHNNITLNFVKISDDNAGTSIWSATWIVYDTHNTKYQTTITAQDSIGNKNSLPLSWADPYTDCNSYFLPSLQGSAFALTSNCQLNQNEVGGLMNGLVTIGASGQPPITLQLSSGATLVLTGGFTFYNTSSSLVTASDHSASIKTSTAGGYLYYIDADGDRYPPNFTTMVYSTNPNLGAGYVMVNNTLSASNGNKVDCYDNNAAAYPGSTYADYNNRGTIAAGALVADGGQAGNYDFNCDGTSDQQKTITFVAGSCDAIACTVTSLGTNGWTLTIPACGSSGSWTTNNGACTGLSPDCFLGSSASTSFETCN